jgi:selenocysteine lyase/cysteine desulfurase
MNDALPTTDLAQRFADIRRSFAGTKAGPYLDVSARCLLYGGARRAFDTYLDQNGDGTLDKKAMFAGVERTRGLFARLIGADADEIAFTRNVTDGIATLAVSLPWKAGDNVVLCESLEHPANVYPWYGVAKRHGVSIRSVGQDDGHIPADRILAMADAATRVVAVSSVSFAPGFRLPLGELGAECRRRGILLVVDGAQSVGALATDVGALKIDVLATSAQKYLMGVYGVGFLYIRRALADTLAPVMLSRFSVDLGDQHEGSSGDTSSYVLARGARRFDVGNYNYPATLAAAESLQLLLDLGPKEVEAYVCGLTREFADRMMEIGLPVFGGRSNLSGGPIVTVGRVLSTDHDAAGDSEMMALHDFLTANGVRLGVRRGLLRFSFHLYNNRDDIDTVISLARQWLGTRRPAESAA